MERLGRTSVPRSRSLNERLVLDYAPALGGDMTHEAPEDAFKQAVRADPRVNTKRLAKELGLSGRAARRLVAELEAEGVVRTRRGRWAALAAVVVLGGALAAWALRPDEDPATRLPGQAPARRPAAVALETDLYKASDAQDLSRVDDARRQLDDEDEPLRLAALRYLVQAKATAHTAAILARVDDPSERVRLVALQLVGQLPGDAVDQRLADVILDSKRPPAERSLATSSLSQRKVAGAAQVAQRLLPALLDASATVRDETSRLLAKLTARSVAVGPEDASRLHAAWQAVLGAEPR